MPTFDSPGTEAQGKVNADIRNATIGPLRGATAHVDATLMGKSLMANVHFDSRSFGRVDINTSTSSSDGQPALFEGLGASDWRRAESTGKFP